MLFWFPTDEQRRQPPKTAPPLRVAGNGTGFILQLLSVLFTQIADGQQRLFDFEYTP
jgi:hypothetical protein